MPVSQREVDELRREGEAMMASGNGGPPTLETAAEQIGYLVAQLRALGLDETETLHGVELALRAARIDRECLCEARGVLRALGYSPELIKLMTALARKAPPKATYRLPGSDGPRRHPVKPVARHAAPADQVDHGALAMWTAPKPAGRRQ